MELSSNVQPVKEAKDSEREGMIGDKEGRSEEDVFGVGMIIWERRREVEEFALSMPVLRERASAHSEITSR